MAVGEDVSGAGPERNRWSFHRLSEAQVDGAADRPAPTQPSIHPTVYLRIEGDFERSSRMDIRGSRATL